MPVSRTKPVSSVSSASTNTSMRSTSAWRAALTSASRSAAIEGAGCVVERLVTDDHRLDADVVVGLEFGRQHLDRRVQRLRVPDRRGAVQPGPQLALLAPCQAHHAARVVAALDEHQRLQHRVVEVRRHPGASLPHGCASIAPRRGRAGCGPTPGHRTSPARRSRWRSRSPRPRRSRGRPSCLASDATPAIEQRDARPETDDPRHRATGEAVRTSGLRPDDRHARRRPPPRAA